ncbi:MAG: TauD/TfdA family dioxygenase [Pseudomonadota bacterium]
MRVASPGERPALLEDRSAWIASDFTSPASYRREFSSAMLAEIANAADNLLASGADLPSVGFRKTELPSTSEFLIDAYDDVENGVGFAVLGGLPVAEWGQDVSRAALAIVGSYFGEITRQNREGEYILDVIDKSAPYDSQFRGYHSNAFLEFHNDGTNVVALMCIETAKEGGESLLLSATTLYNELSQTRPDVLPTLMRGYRHSRRNQALPGQPPVMENATPVFSFIEGVFHNCYSRISIDSSLDQGLEQSPAERDALDAVDEVLARPELVLNMELRQGDIQLVNNFTLLHSRKAYVDHSEDRRRHLMRLWLTDPTSKYNGPGKMDFYLPEESYFLKTRGYEIFQGN